MDPRTVRPFEFMAGYPNDSPQQYMNLGWLTSPYPDKKGQGDWGPNQMAGVYYNPWNPTYPYPMDVDAGTYTFTYPQDTPIYMRSDRDQIVRSNYPSWRTCPRRR